MDDEMCSPLWPRMSFLSASHWQTKSTRTTRRRSRNTLLTRTRRQWWFGYRHCRYSSGSSATCVLSEVVLAMEHLPCCVHPVQERFPVGLLPVREEDLGGGADAGVYFQLLF